MFDDLYPEQAAAAVDARARRLAEPTPAPSRFSLWSTTTAAPRGVAAGAAEAAGSTSDMLGALGSVLGAMPGSGRGMFSTGTPEERKQINEARTKLLKDGPDYMSEGGRSFRNVAKDYSPDPATAHIAEQTVFNLFRVGSKALTAAAVGGNVPGAVVAGLEEGFTQADQLAQQGVDVNTRTQVGAVTALTNAVGFALPVAGKTWAQTAGLALAGGPASFVAQNAATREILQRADYSKLADQYDPFDPVGLALSTVLPLSFGALAMRGKGAAAGRPAPDVAPVAGADVDAARVALVRQQVDAANPVPGDIEAIAAHDAAVTRALDQLMNGQRVDAQDLPDAAIVKAAEAMRLRVDSALSDVRRVPDLGEFIKSQGIDLEPPKQREARGNAFISWIKSVGGIKVAEKIDIVGERGIRGNYAGIFTKGGKALDVLVEDAIQAGYLSRADVDAATDTGGTRALSELIRRATMGEKVQTVEQVEAAKIADAQTRAAQTAAEQMERELIALGVDPTPARGNADALGQFLAENRTALVNAKLAELDTQLQQVRAEIGEAYNLNPRQIDAQQRIALAAELDEAAVERAAIQAADEVDFLNRIEEILSHEPRSKEAAGRQQGATPDASIPAGNAAEAVATQRPAFDYTATARQAADLLNNGESAAQIVGRAQASGQPLAPELQNMLVGLSEFGGRSADLLAQIDALKAKAGDTAPMDVIANAVERMRAGQGPDVPQAAANPLEARLQELEDGNPTALESSIAVEFDDGKPTRSVTLREYLDTVKAEAAQEAADANLLQVAANCFLTSGA